jgi:predicted enzyme related to lactoylglutathione lyase
MPSPNDAFQTLIRKTRTAVLLFLVLMVSGLCGACATSPPLVPKVTPEPTHLRLDGKFVWFDLFTSDLQATRQFYEALFGWSFQETPCGEKQVLTITREGVPIANVVSADKTKIKDQPSRWLSYMSVADVDQTVLRIGKNHGSVYMPPKNLPDRGRVAVVKDPEGAVFAVVTTSEGDPPDPAYDLNDFLGSELWAKHLETAVKFYQALVDYEIEMVDVGNEKDYHLLVTDDQPRAGVVQIPWDDVKPNWVPYVAVEDVAAVAARVQPLGGRLLIAPNPEIREGNAAIIADPSGAVFGIQER